ncbi:ParA family protein [Novosphingobium sp. FKTRR1]|uniref:ParA family protein n=1 Tax=unclassified Novosphingobium TaxID=2644732 RepID=UPI001CF0AF90|nr:ParA family protein [Novosphingobium sp. FKTRR1]
MAVIGIYSVKGGVGKTTLSVDLAWRSAVRSGHRTLLWDLDPQGGCAFLLGMEPRPGRRAASIFQRDGRPRDFIEPTPYPNLSILQADDSLRALGLALARLGQRRRMATLSGFLAGEYDRIIVDCPPVLNDISDQVISAADLLIVPLPPSPLAARALAMIRAEILANHDRHPPILPVLSMFDTRRKLHREVHNGFAAGWPFIPMASAVEQMAVQRKPIGVFAGWTDASQRMQRVWDAIEAKLRLRATLAS